MRAGERFSPWARVQYGHYWMLPRFGVLSRFSEEQQGKDRSGACFSLSLVEQRHGSLPFSSSRLPLLLPFSTNGFYCHHLSIDVPPPDTLGSSDKRPCSFSSRWVPCRGERLITLLQLALKRVGWSGRRKAKRKQAGWQQSLSVTALPQCRTRHEYVYCHFPFMPHVFADTSGGQNYNYTTVNKVRTGSTKKKTMQDHF